ncbi:MAG: hypothetical protein ACFFEU_03545 [Candidatus Thorarchaeota archaeon]
MDNEDSEDSGTPLNDLSLLRDRLVQLGIVLEIIASVFMYLGTSATYRAGMILLLAGVFVLLIGLARYVSKRMSDSDTWWVIKLGPTARPN